MLWGVGRFEKWEVGIVDQEKVNKLKPDTHKSDLCRLPEVWFPTETFPVPYTVHSSVELQARGHVFYAMTSPSRRLAVRFCPATL